MAWAWSKSGLGHAETDVVIRDPVVVTASLPKFLAPEDQSSLRLDIAATDAPSGTYTLAVTGNGPVSVGGAESQEVALTAGETTTVTLPLTANTPGDGAIDIALSGADGIAVGVISNQRGLIKGRPGEKPEHGAPLFSRKYGQSTGVVIFDKVFVPWERVFLAGEWEFSGDVTYNYATHHRHSCIAARAGFQAADDHGHPVGGALAGDVEIGRVGHPARAPRRDLDTLHDAAHPETADAA
mgnify:CR=1 FL=1